jgi:S-adenosylmethionine:tRNA ribosyltransferase-isomerase
MNLTISDFNYELPNEKIAYFPLEKRDESKLLIYKNQKIQETIFKSIPNIIQDDSILVFNETKVVNARLLFKKDTGAEIEIFCLEPAQNIPAVLSLTTKSSVVWNCYVGNAKRWKEETLQTTFQFENQSISLFAEKMQIHESHFEIKFSWQPKEFTFSEILTAYGHVPLPPYIKRKDNNKDIESYQTVYAKYEGSVAAPTAGLHFTDEVLLDLSKKNIQKETITLHVGAGTFKPVTKENYKEHLMHAELAEVSLSTLQSIANEVNKQIIPVGTTSLRTLESVYWFGVMLIRKHASIQSDVFIPQHIADEYFDAVYSRKEAIQAVIDYLIQKNSSVLIFKTAIMISPGYKIRMADAIITNFHQPKSTLLLLVYAFVGEAWKTIYEYALTNNFRFLSYGDSSLLYLHAKG